MATQKPANIFLSSLGALLVSSQSSATCKLATTQAPLLELYTRKGCSSCPPADAWLSQQIGKSPSANGPIALAFHVDYWDSLGWTYRLASAKNSDRQRSVSNAARAGVYTPGFFLNGIEWRGLFSAKALPTAKFEPVPINISARLLERTLEISAVTSDNMFVAVSESSLANQVKAGENRNRLLKHDRVVRVWQPLNAKAQITLPADFNLAKAKLVVWHEINGKASGAAQVDLLNCK